MSTIQALCANLILTSSGPLKSQVAQYLSVNA